MKKFLLSFIAVFVICFGLSGGLTLQAVKYGDTKNAPKGYWTPHTAYYEAINKGDSAGILSSGKQLIDIWLAGGTAEQRAAQWMDDVANNGWNISDMWSVSRTLAQTYEKTGDIENAVRYYKMALSFVDPYKALIPLTPGPGGKPGDMEFARTEIQNIVKSYEAVVNVYAELHDGSGDISCTGALHEPCSGIYYGEPADNAVKDSLKKTGATVIYAEFEHKNLQSRVEHDLGLKTGFKRSDYSLIQIAWNFISEGAALPGVLNERKMITEAAEFLAGLDIPILLRIGAEMNIWQKSPADPQEYIKAYRFIADIMRQHAPNVALLWSVNNISSAGLTWQMFYPGEKYVDWVGVSLYTHRYFLGNPNTTGADAAIWRTGPFANPVSFIESLADAYGGRHPLIISEGGVTLRNTSNNEDLTSWALPRMRQTYAYIPVLFPQVKGIFWYNVNMGGAQRYDFSVSPQAKKLYEELTGNPYFLARGQEKSPVTYKKLGTAAMPADAVVLLTYAPYFTFDDISVRYKLNGTDIGQKQVNIPYRQVLNLSGLADGEHRLTAEVYKGTGLLKAVHYYVLKSGAEVIISTEKITPPAS